MKITCCKCHGTGTYEIPTGWEDDSCTFEDWTTVKCELCKGTGKLDLGFYEELQRRIRKGRE